jgi:hypothetical protein
MLATMSKETLTFVPSSNSQQETTIPSCITSMNPRELDQMRGYPDVLTMFLRSDEPAAVPPLLGCACEALNKDHGSISRYASGRLGSAVWLAGWMRDVQ